MNETTKLRLETEKITGFGMSNAMVTRYLFEASKKTKKEKKHLLNAYILNPNDFVEFIYKDSFCLNNFNKKKRNKW